MPAMKTPGVYIVEKNAFPNSVVEVATAVPVFIGYTEMADNNGTSLSGKAWRITSMAEYRKYFGGAPEPIFDVTKVEKAAGGDDEAKDKAKPEDCSFKFNGVGYKVARAASSPKYLMYYSMMFFYQNGGGPCYVVSVGDYTDKIEKGELAKGLLPLIKEPEPTMVVIPEAITLENKMDCYSLQQAVLAHCGGKMKNRVAILDVWEGFRDRQDSEGDRVVDFRNALGTSYLDYAAAYYPWLDTTIVQDNDVDFSNIIGGMLDGTDEAKSKAQDAKSTALMALLTAEIETAYPDKDIADNKLKQTKKDDLLKEVTKLGKVNKPPEGDEEPIKPKLLHNALVTSSPLYKKLMEEIKGQLNLLPPSPAIAGIYTMVDNSRGVWKAPANVSLNAVVSPTVNISDDEQEDLNVTPQGKSINAIRPFIGEGTLIWGARTLDGNSLDWRYINVRRTMIMLEESIKLAAKAYVFEPNVSSTWISMESMIGNFLYGIWKRGGLAGSVPDDAYSVSVGLGKTMIPEDILEGILRITVLVAISRPAEFIEITFQQQMQKS